MTSYKKQATTYGLLLDENFSSNKKKNLSLNQSADPTTLNKDEDFSDLDSGV